MITCLEGRNLSDEPIAKMIELDQMWSQMIDEARRQARDKGRNDIADYLDLKARNDALRTAGVQWLMQAAAEILATAEGSRVEIERDQPHNFPYRGANLVGGRLKIRYGVRCLTIEAGWTRTPSDGFMRGGALALARFTHFGMPKQDREILLRDVNGVPVWFEAADGNGSSAPPIDSEFVLHHLAILSGIEP